MTPGHAKTALAVLSSSFVVALSASPAAADGCTLLPCGPPTVSMSSARATSATIATFSGTVNPDGGDTQYWFNCDCQGPTPVSSPHQTLSGSYTSSDVTWSTDGLLPNETYEVTLSASNAYGNTTTQPLSFTTPLAPGLPVRITGLKRYERFGSNLGTTALLPSSGSGGSVGELQVSYPPFRHFVTVESGVASNVGEIPFSNTTRWAGLSSNALIRVHLNGCVSVSNNPDDCRQTRHPSDSRVFFRYVLPATFLEVVPIKHLNYPYVLSGLGAVFYANVPPGYRPPILFFYTRNNREDSFRIQGRARLRIRRLDWDGGTVRGIVALHRFFAPYSQTLRGKFLLCTRTAVAPNMGPGFNQPACGSPTLKSPGPLGSEWIGHISPNIELAPWTK